jgi:hypothetical protein
MFIRFAKIQFINLYITSWLGLKQMSQASPVSLEGRLRAYGVAFFLSSMVCNYLRLGECLDSLPKLSRLGDVSAHRGGGGGDLSL